MKPKTIVFFVFLAFVVSGLGASDKGPVAVSPGSDVGLSVVGGNCPTFSWTAVEWAIGYRIEVFEAATAEILPYEQMAAVAYPVVSKEIKGRALSWTPSSDEQLSNGGIYIWYIQAMDSYGTAKWSEGRSFIVKMEDRLAAVIDKVTETLKANGVSEDVINKVLTDMIPETEGSNINTQGSQSSGYKTQDKLGVQGTEAGSNTLYGEDAGLSLVTGTNNSFFGFHAGISQTDGSANCFFGYDAGRALTGGGQNVFIGEEAGMNFTNGSSNIFIGSNAGDAAEGTANVYIGRMAARLLEGGSNTIVGFGAGYDSPSGDDNTFLGHSAGRSNAVNYNTFIGAYSGYSNTTGDGNTFLGKDAGYSNTTGDRNTFLGQDAGSSNQEGNNNTFIGRYAGYNNTTSNNIFIGYSSGFNNTSGSWNTFLGQDAGFSNTTGESNVFLGNNAGRNNETGNGNIFLGRNAGYNETGSNKLYIDNSNSSSPLIFGDFSSDFVAINGKLGVGTQSPGYDLEVETTGKNAVLLLDRTDGAKAGFASSSNMALLGTVTNHPLMLGVNYAWRLQLKTDNSLLMSNGAKCTAGGVWQDASSRAYKENILDLTAQEAKDALLNLNPVKYNYKSDREDEHLGFIAEDVPDLVASKDRKGMSPMDVVAVLTKVVQEQQEALREQQDILNFQKEALEGQQRTLEEQQDIISELQKRIANLEKRSQ